MSSDRLPDLRRSARSASALLLVAVAACAAPGGQPAASSAPAGATAVATVSPTHTPQPTATRAPRPTPTAAVATVCTAGSGEVALVIDGKANLFAAGLAKPEEPGGGGAGVLPPVVELPPGESRVVTVPCTDGKVNCCFGSPDTWATPGGTVAFLTDIDSHGAISGIVVGDRAIFLAGVFLTDATPQAPPPERLDQTGKNAFKAFAPELGQTFVIGTGEASSWAVPAGATRLFLGIIDGYYVTGPHGWYGNNSGWFEATVRVTAE